MFNLYLITQSQNRGYDTYSGAVVVADSPEAARNIYPGGGLCRDAYDLRAWASPDLVTVIYLGPCEDSQYYPGSVVLSSFQAG